MSRLSTFSAQCQAYTIFFLENMSYDITLIAQLNLTCKLFNQHFSIFLLCTKQVDDNLVKQFRHFFTLSYHLVQNIKYFLSKC